ncbi:hypothetical protein ACOY59_17590, partial [Enterobacter roggenkampii]
IGPDPRNFNQRVSLGRNDLLIRTFPMTIYALPRITKKIKRIKRNLRLYFLSLWRHETFSYFISECSLRFYSGCLCA